MKNPDITEVVKNCIRCNVYPVHTTRWQGKYSYSYRCPGCYKEIPYQPSETDARRSWRENKMSNFYFSLILIIAGIILSSICIYILILSSYLDNSNALIASSSVFSTLRILGKL